VWLTPHLRDPQPEGERETQSKRKRVCKPCLCTLYTVVPREKYMSIPAAYAMSEDFVCSY